MRLDLVLERDDEVSEERRSSVLSINEFEKHAFLFNDAIFLFLLMIKFT